MSIDRPLSPRENAGLNLQPDELALVSAVADLAEPVIVTRADLVAPGPTIIAASRGMSALTLYSETELVGRSPRLFQGPLTDRAVLGRLRETLARGERFAGSAVNYRKDGSTYLLQWTIDPIRDASGRITHYFSLQQDVTAQSRFANEWLAAEARARAALSDASRAMTLIAETILVLEKTKRSFRSKELGLLRERLVQASRSLARPGPAAGSTQKT